MSIDLSELKVIQLDPQRFPKLGNIRLLSDWWILLFIVDIPKLPYFANIDSDEPYESLDFPTLHNFIYFSLDWRIELSIDINPFMIEQAKQPRNIPQSNDYFGHTLYETCDFTDEYVIDQMNLYDINNTPTTSNQSVINNRQVQSISSYL